MRLDWRRRTIAALSAGSSSLGEGAHPALRAGTNSHRQWLGVRYEGDGQVGVRAQIEAATHHLITPGKPMENGCDESFHGKFRENAWTGTGS
jgi:Integrase core domain